MWMKRNGKLMVELRYFHQNWRDDDLRRFIELNLEYKSACDDCHPGKRSQKTWTWSYVPCVIIGGNRKPKIHFQCSSCQDEKITFEFEEPWVILDLLDDRLFQHVEYIGKEILGVK
jgi:hypothetical protein